MTYGFVLILVLPGFLVCHSAELEGPPPLKIDQGTGGINKLSAQTSNVTPHHSLASKYKCASP